MSLAAAKAEARRTAAGARRAAWHAGPAAGALSALLAGYRGVPLAGYLPIRDEIDPTPAMAEAAAHGPVGVPVVTAPGAPLEFHAWAPDAALATGAFGVSVPATAAVMVPQIVIVPLLAFDRSGARLGYGGGFYDRTLAGLRAAGPLLAVGFAWSAQEIARVPVETTDAPLDMIVTEAGAIDL